MIRSHQICMFFWGLGLGLWCRGYIHIYIYTTYLYALPSVWNLLCCPIKMTCFRFWESSLSFFSVRIWLFLLFYFAQMESLNDLLPPYIVKKKKSKEVEWMSEWACLPPPSSLLPSPTPTPNSNGERELFGFVYSVKGWYPHMPKSQKSIV